MASFMALADHHSASCFFNSLFREWPGYFRTANAFEIGQNPTLQIGLRRYSELGRHEYTGLFSIRSGVGTVSVTLKEAIQFTCSYLAADFKSDPHATSVFYDRVLLSHQNMSDAFKAHGNLPSIGSFIESEQSLLIGHNFHPTPKSRDGFSAEDQLRYSPEMKGHFRLRWLVAHPSVVSQKSAASFQHRDWLRELFLTEGIPVSDIPSEMILVPVHPWQFNILKLNPVVDKYFREGKLIEVGESTNEWFPTSSLRSVFRGDAPFMLKFSMSVKLTNSIRHLLGHEVERGLQLHDVLQSPLGQQFLESQPQFSVITEPAYIALRDENGNALNESIVVCRENPFATTGNTQTTVLATLTQDLSVNGSSLLKDLLIRHKILQRIWFKQFLSTVVKPIILAQANFGIVLGAHQQNLIIGLEAGLPVRSYFRDCQGTGYTELGYSLFSESVPLIQRENGNVVDPKLGQSLFVYYLILNSTFNVITALSSSDNEESHLLEDLRAFLVGILEEGVQDPTYIRSLLEDEFLMHKGNFICSLRNINENTTVDPLAIYVPVKNSIRSQDHAHAKHV